MNERWTKDEWMMKQISEWKVNLFVFGRTKSASSKSANALDREWNEWWINRWWFEMNEWDETIRWLKSDAHVLMRPIEWCLQCLQYAISLA